MPDLVLGPLLRYAGSTEATVWVETDAPCNVEVLGHSEHTFTVSGHHYALVVIGGLAPGSTTPYEVALDGRRRWPAEDSELPASVIRTSEPGRPVKISFGSCRLAVPHEPPYTLSQRQHKLGRELDALRALALRMAAGSPDAYPDALLMLGDQVYADMVPPATGEFIRARRDRAKGPGDWAADFEEYAFLYRESWSDPVIRWLLSTLPTAMIFDDHDVCDDWNTSAAWVEHMRSQSWWDERVIGGFATYWLYQHLGNLAPADLATDPMYARVREADGDAAPALREFALRADRENAASRWSFAREIGPARLVMIDSRAGRVLTPGDRQMVDATEWKWITDHVRGDCDHLLIGTSLPWLLMPATHYAEAWSEAVCDGAWGRAAAWAAEHVRQAFDLEHWSAFRRSFDDLAHLLADVGAGRRGEPPAAITVLSGDVHHCYLAEVGFPRGSGVRSAVWQAVCSPFRNPLNASIRMALRAQATEPMTAITRALARSAGVPDPPVRWRFVEDKLIFDNQVATLELDGRHGTFRLERAVGDFFRPELLESMSCRIA